MFSKYFAAFFIFLYCLSATAQNCSLSLNGYVKDPGNGEPLEAVNIYLEEYNRGVISDEKGFFQIDDLCKGHYHLVLSHIGCESQRVYIDLYRDTIVNLEMEHSATELESVLVTGNLKPATTQNTAVINEQNIADNASENLSNMLESITGVSTLKNGNGIAKPVVHGLYGNRLTILNNGVSQSGQQWGNDHSPEIDPLVANKIRVVKGTGVLEYMGSNLGSVVIVEPKKIEREPHLHGRSSYFFETNGLSHGLNLQLQRYTPLFAWRVTGTLKKSGDKKTADYYLNNTGSQEANMALQLEKSFSEKLFVELYASTFNTDLGVLRGSHIGNLTDLEDALQRETPFFTEADFSYSIDAPRQKVNHHLVKLHSKYFVDQSQWFDLTLAGQFNNRKEFDVRRSGRSDIPALSLQQYAFFAEGKYQKDFAKDWSLKTGAQFNLTDNTNNPETGILPLIPDYLSYESALFLVGSKKWEKSFFELGIRYDNVLQKVVAISNTLPREIIRYTNNFHNISSSAGWTYSLNDHLSMAYNIGYATRNPAVNELYSGGLHQGVSGIEEGDPELKPEQSIKTTLGFNASISHKFSFEMLMHSQRINDYIYLNPQDEFRPTIRGAFPVFRYEQTKAELYGLDLSGQLNLSTAVYLKVKYSYLKGNDLGNNLPLINIPSNNINGSLGYQFLKPLKIGKYQLENLEIELNNQYVFEQSNLQTGQDYVVAPPAYNLLGLKIASDLQLGASRLRVALKGENLLNISYRDYLNRQRYFADDLGFNASVNISLKF